MKIINENLEMIDYEEKKKEIENVKESATLRYKMMAKMTLMDLVYDMNRNTCHKMNFMIIGAQLIVLTISIICQALFDKFRVVISLAGAIGSIVLMCLVIINTKISDKAIRKANKQREVIEECIDKLEKRK